MATHPTSEAQRADAVLDRDDRTDALPPEQGGAEAGTQIDESSIDDATDVHRPSTENDVT